MSLTKKILIALVVGVVVGLGFNLFAPNLFDPIDTYLLTPLGQIFLNLIMMVVVPLVFFSIILGAAGLGDPKALGRIGGKTLIFFMVTSVIALSLAISLAYLIQPGEPGLMGNLEEDYSAQEAPPVMDTLLNIIPQNPIAAMASGEMLQIIAFAILIGFALARLGEKTKGIVKLVEQGNEIMMFLVGLAMKLAPYGAFGLIASAIGKLGLSVIQSMIAYMLTIIIALILHTIITYGGGIWLIAKRNPFEFFKAFFPVMTVAFSTSSSNATLPTSMKVVEEDLKVSKPVTSFIVPLGATINMDGTAIMQAVATVFIAQVFAVSLTFTDLLIIILTATLASIGTAGVPGVGMIMLAMVLTSVGLPVEGITLVLAVDRILDMMRTAVNVTGDATCAVIVDRFEQERIEKEKLEAKHS
ncbi:sodium:dicarboxylate symporter [Alkalihalobacillus alcalophilus ATCC 27647 = CGMCC 1.3604]|uniref:Proton/sodium ion:glutamate/aspartate symporter transporter n=1 Tax=Alkalihalobacillus alcalophilus ATCC 27647 = CGMCC 1.3604 TaxID=1218173 RepID=J8TUC7_ALKAL|nr:dicarboxylate/amino acid:cation symporter [Alkalihalobacillus alcalophilus]AFV25671.1 proton/sodium ion:glutamate/aspartate symporter transporter [Alkalihalobacillus alcalophilus ATCC 27647 = CGMCC 1.3604]KGA96103.1 sodium:dicarboxylate symporter [Alkalihalobacillus alcalophilus ATCC 27647 = CGMCC 1.3604]MED1562842.1 dicarboxylate/amino acid:cation symporter [Alkalihalobacillus alcalophilus]THG90018.1 sodium:dicarboxylate symporter [Alkalihalobacillus alcalophilus ATCC 27647 = CGMCC 1.3604]